jgi:adenine-specific DNA methylase
VFPTTRYQGSKRKLIPWLLSCLDQLEFESVLDLFGGTASVSYALKERGKRVHYNDYLQFNQQVGLALIENQLELARDASLEAVLAAGNEAADASNRTIGFIAESFAGIYFTDKENRWLDGVVPAIAALPESPERAILWAALGQAALIKRPYNLFHRANLAMRERNVERSFGNKVTWDRPFDHYLKNFVQEYNEAVFDSGVPCKSTCLDAQGLVPDTDLVYLDPPYTSSRGNGVDYHGFYHFLEGLLAYDNWSDQLDLARKHKPLARRSNPWSHADQVAGAFEEVFTACESVPLLALSYRADGLPPVVELCNILQRFGRSVQVHEASNYQYALSGRKAGEVLIIAAR